MYYDPTLKPELETKIEPWRQLLLDAANIQDQRGHCQGQYEDDDGKVCPLGALRIARHVGKFSRADYNHALQALNTSTPIQIWADLLGRTKEEVVLELRRAAKREII